MRPISPILVVVGIIIIVVAILVSLILSMHPAAGENRARLVIWIEPWMPNTTIPRWAIPGIIIVYMCSPGDLACLGMVNESLTLIKHYLELGNPVFVALYPTYWTYRGPLNDPAYFNNSQLVNVVHELKSIDPSGKGLYIGFSEQWGCLNSAKCSSILAGVYRWLEGQFPNAEFYYYDCCVSSSTIISFAREANITLLGYDIYSYVHISGYTIAISPALVNSIKAVKLAGFKLIIGEIGFRVCDANAWYNPSQANPGIQISWNCTAPAVYLAEVLNQASAFKPKFIGIWVWDDCCGFAVSQNPLMIQVLYNYTTGRSYMWFR